MINWWFLKFPNKTFTIVRMCKVRKGYGSMWLKMKIYCFELTIILRKFELYHWEERKENLIYSLTQRHILFIVYTCYRNRDTDIVLTDIRTQSKNIQYTKDYINSVQNHICKDVANLVIEFKPMQTLQQYVIKKKLGEN